ncbi:hypothetical protein QC761_0057650 [Podospora bellae-mahoneyi]|uniref:Uncharacterized protein n=1 Tax=Podospora bellae-mahoneyi TaxID=2093777 RepID=A0ABR0FLT8_9PEZI|nr:hypothetical protein QC761_0057650 [Podospora bellae-mahoneyi]
MYHAPVPCAEETSVLPKVSQVMPLGDGGFIIYIQQVTLTQISRGASDGLTTARSAVPQTPHVFLHTAIASATPGIQNATLPRRHLKGLAWVSSTLLKSTWKVLSVCALASLLQARSFTPRELHRVRAGVFS